ncbi:MAG: hypothetical protein WC333_07135 [Dehalococcoidia bacterium]|jgi:glutamate synthase domain-containing protein 3
MAGTTKKKETEEIVRIDASGLPYRALNARLKAEAAGGARRIEVRNVTGQRYIGTDLERPVDIDVFGTPGNDLGAFMDGSRIEVHGNVQDCCGNTMNNGEIIVHGHAGDITGLSARGGRIFVRDYVGYRAGIHMKEYEEKKPVIVIGGTAQDFLGEYMAGGVVVVLGLELGTDEMHGTRFIGTGMHGGVIYLRGRVEDYQLGKEVGVSELSEPDHAVLRPLLADFAAYFDMNVDDISKGGFIKLYPKWLRPYGRLYAY